MASSQNSKKNFFFRKLVNLSHEKPVIFENKNLVKELFLKYKLENLEQIRNDKVL